MKNIEYYWDKILPVTTSNKDKFAKTKDGFRGCMEVDCYDCEWIGEEGKWDECMAKKMGWLFTEHEEKTEMNFLYWRDEISKITDVKGAVAVVDGKPVNCFKDDDEINLSCHECDFGDDITHCESRLMKWLYSPHKVEQKPTMFTDWQEFKKNKPPLMKAVLTSNGSDVIRAWFDDECPDEWMTADSSLSVIVYKWWMPLPQPPKERKGLS